MKIETILNAFDRATYERGRSLWDDEQRWMRRTRQADTFRARILREFAIMRNFAEVNGFDRTQAWFWTDQWQAKEREVDEFINQGDVQSFDTMENFLNTLEHEDEY